MNLCPIFYITKESLFYQGSKTILKLCRNGTINTQHSLDVKHKFAVKSSFFWQ